MTESPASILDGLTFEAVEWLPSGADTGLVRVRGRWAPGVGRPDGLPALCASVGDGVARYESLPDAPGAARGDGSLWRGAYLVAEAIVRGGVWLEWASGERSALPVPAGLDERAAPSLVVVEPVEESDSAGGELIDRAVLADRRARRAEAAEQAQARVASEALRALDALELRGTELEARVESLVAERDALTARAEELERQAPRDEHQRAALADALAAAAAARRAARDWQLRMRAAEVARTSDAVRLRVLEAREASAAPVRTELAEQEAALESARARAAALEAEAARAREQAVAAAADLDDARRDFTARLRESADVAASWEARAEAAEAAVAAVRADLAEREGELAAARGELDAVRAELSETRANAETRLAAARAAAEAEVGEVRSSVEEQRRAWDAQLTDLRVALEAERAARSALSDALDAETAALASLHAQLNTERAELAALRAAAADPSEVAEPREELARERAARQADQSALAALRDDLAAERAAVADLRGEVDALRAEVSPPDVAAQLRAEMESARQADRAELTALRADLNAERAAREAHEAEIARLRTELESAGTTEGGLLDRVAELDRRAAGLASELELQRRAREQAEAAAGAARTSDADSGRVVADLEAAASALRERPPNGVTEEAEAPPAEAEVVPGEEVEAEAVPADTPPERREIVSAARGPSRAHATGQSQRHYPWLRGALVKLAHDDPETAGRLIAGLLPVQAAIVQGPVDYDLTIAEVGTFAVTVAGGRAWVKTLEGPRGRKEAEFHLASDALTLAELIAGVPHRLSRFRGPARVSGRKRRAKPLRAIPQASLSLAEAARAGARLEPGLVFRTLPYVIHAAWARDHAFTVAQQVTSDPPETWYLTIGNRRGIRVSSTPPEQPADASVTMTPEAFGHLLRGEPAPPGHRPVVRGDRQAVALLKAWLDRAQAV